MISNNHKYLNIMIYETANHRIKRISSMKEFKQLIEENI